MLVTVLVYSVLTSLPFVHTACRYYRLNGLSRNALHELELKVCRIPNSLKLLRHLI